MLNFLLFFLLGLSIGAIGMLLVYRNNQAKMAALADKLNKEIEDLKDKSKKN